MTPGICRVCHGPAMSDRSTLCRDCFVSLYPDAQRRRTDTQYARSLAQMNEAYDRARLADEADTPKKDRGPA